MRNYYSSQSVSSDDIVWEYPKDKWGGHEHIRLVIDALVKRMRENKSLDIHMMSSAVSGNKRSYEEKRQPVIDEYGRGDTKLTYSIYHYDQDVTTSSYAVPVTREYRINVVNIHNKVMENTTTTGNSPVPTQPRRSRYARKRRARKLLKRNDQ